MATTKGEEIKVRVPAGMKSAFQRLADERMTTESELAREAFLDYLLAHKVTLAEIREEAPYKTKADTAAPDAGNPAATEAQEEKALALTLGLAREAASEDSPSSGTKPGRPPSAKSGKTTYAGSKAKARPPAGSPPNEKPGKAKPPQKK